MATYFNRYEPFKANGGVETLPFIKLTQKSTDKLVVYRLGTSRLDKFSHFNKGFFDCIAVVIN